MCGTGGSREHWGDGGGRLISLYPVWRAVAGLDPHQLSTFLRLPVAAQSKAGLSGDGLPGQTTVPLYPSSLRIDSSPFSPKSPHLSALGCSYKKIKGSGTCAGWSWTRAFAGVCRGLLEWCLWGLGGISLRLVVIDSI